MEKIEALEKITIYFKDGSGKYTDMITGIVKSIEIWKSIGKGGRDILIRRFKVEG